ncbi:DUF2889 domain-containing protein [Neptuniibacter halophilus]|uniref:DUF2889 domain-containing protein n=1 Tax=Neptuniibacter halophilus TaxID=651666 RepID=UPI0025734909|nr:DUF2889 domain-containing protein [Neptuniibacter halophilus]
MPLSKPARRRAQHNRTIFCNGFLREDGLWDIEAAMTDVKTHDVDNEERGGYVAAGEAFHDLSIRLTLDQRLTIHQVEACIDRSPFRMCSAISNAFRKLEGTRIGPGWLSQAKQLLGGVQGCTHMNELLPVLATTAVQSMWPSMGGQVLTEGAKLMLNSCHTWGQSSAMVRHYLPEHYRDAESETREGENRA